MNCWHCSLPAVGTCRFCGRGVCADDFQARPYILELYGESPKALIVEDALWCRACTPRGEPVDVPELS